jgi:hypothetical protein
MNRQGFVIRRDALYWNETEWMKRPGNAQVFRNVARAYKLRERKLGGQGADIVDLSTNRAIPEPTVVVNSRPV